METIKTVVANLSEEFGIEINIMMVLLRECPSSVFGRNPTLEIKKLLKEFLARNITSDVKVFTIPFSGKVYKSQMRGMPISHYAPFSSVGRVYRKIAKEVVRSSDSN